MAPEYQQIESLVADAISKIYASVSSKIESDEANNLKATLDAVVSNLMAIATTKDQQYQAEAEKCKNLGLEISSLKMELKNCKRYALSSQIEMTKGNVMIRTSKAAKDVAEYICNVVAKSGAPKPASSAFLVQQINTDNNTKTKSPKKATRNDKTTGSSNLFKAFLGSKLKNDFFKGLAATTATRSSSKEDFQVSHDIPAFLSKQKSNLERAAFSLRKEHRDKEIKTKISLKGLNLALFVKLRGSPDWMSIDNDKVSHLRGSPVEPKEGETSPPKVVSDILKALDTF